MSLKKVDVEQRVNLKPFTTIKIGGEAEFFFTVHTSDGLRKTLKNIDCSYYLLGNGSNLLIKNSLLKKPVIKLGKEFRYVKVLNSRASCGVQNKASILEVGAAASLASVLKFCIRHDLGGLHPLVGIPATFGGLLAMNASAFGRQISDNLKEVEVLDRNGQIKRFGKEQILFGYRSSSLKDYIILRAWFRLFKESNLKDKIKRLFLSRYEAQDVSFPSCGCIFKNSQGYPAGFLIDSCGLKGLHKGGAQVSRKHANFIINIGNATYSDVDYLIRTIKDKVYRKFGISLEEEVERWA